MEVQGKNAGDPQPTGRRILKAQSDVIAAKQGQVRASGSDAANQAAGPDRVELSDSTSNAVEAQRARDEVRAARLEELRTELAEHGTLNTPERVGTAASRILEG